MSTNIRPSTGDVFRDLGFSSAESEDLRLRSDLLMKLQYQIAARGQSQSQIAGVLGVSQPRVNNLVKGRLDLFSLDSLVEMLDRLGNRVEVTIHAKGDDTAIMTTADATVTAAWAGDTVSTEPVGATAPEVMLIPDSFFGVYRHAPKTTRCRQSI